ncbi:MAG TPA: SDR family oxidoreductase [Myxococcaceae bacterium]|nr:SDR family oxidoreductase [Myxococcaceae bacterium]
MPGKGMTAVITGASRGIGRAAALRFAQDGYEVWGLARSMENLEKLKREAAQHGAELHAARVDASSREEVLAACETILAENGPPTVLINNAGIALSAPLAKTSLDDFDRLMAINIVAPFFFCRELMPAMAAAGGGRVINIASTAALKGFKYTSAYCASKHALLGMTRALAVEFAKKGVTVNAICPGWTDTDMLQGSARAISLATGRSHEAARDALAQMNPMGRLIRPEQVAELCLFLASPAAAAVTGAAYVMDGGEAV